MAEQTKIEWTDATWNPITGCTLVDEGCRNCYAARMAATRLKNHPSRKGLARLNAAGQAKFTGEVRFNEDWLDQPLRWRKPRMIFVCAHGDLFHEDVPDEWIDRVFAVIAMTPQHTFQILTKRPDRMRAYFQRDFDDGFMPAEARIEHRAKQIATRRGAPIPKGITLISTMPWPHVWLGTSVSDQASADDRIPHLLKATAAVRFVSAEPLLGPLELEGSGWLPTIDWVICGGESGPYARPMHPDWARGLRDQCQAAGVPFFFKQWGEWLPGDLGAAPDVWFQNSDWMDINKLPDIDCDDNWAEEWATDDYEGHALFRKMGKKASGRTLDGREWNEAPNGCL